jgi:c(7)-type cytochrome triheme protein
MKRFLGIAVLSALLLWPTMRFGLAALGDMVFEREGVAEGDPFPPSVFPHWIHRVQYRCYVCHSALFEMKQGANEVTMDAIGEGQYCGACHNGRNAFDVEFKTCTWCHKIPEE